MRYRIDWKRLGMLILLGTMIVILLRGCFFALNKRVEQPEEFLQSGQEIQLKVYNHVEKKMMDLTMEEYLVGVVAAEMPASFELEALKAQAVAARTFAVSKLGQRTKDHGDICTDSTCCQSWKSKEKLQKNWSQSFEEKYQKVREAVYSTAGKIMVYEGKPIQALYHSTSGGMTENSENVFSTSLPYLRAVESPGEESASRYKSSKTISLKNFVKTLNKKCDGANLTEKNAKKEVKITSRFDSGRVEEIKVGKVKVTGREFRQILDLDSANFTIDFSGDDVIITTYGFGHGVGMSQYGANAMAKNSQKYDEILKHYYTGITIKNWFE